MLGRDIIPDEVMTIFYEYIFVPIIFEVLTIFYQSYIHTISISTSHCHYYIS